MTLDASTLAADISTAPQAVDDSPAPQPRQRIKVLLLATSTAGGVGQHVYQLAKRLSRSEFDLTLAYGPGYPLDAAIENLGLPVLHMSLSRGLSPVTNLRGLVQLYRILRNNRFDILCMECSMAGFVGRIAGWLTRIPIRIFVLQVYASHAQQPRLQRWCYRMIERCLDPLTTRYVAVCEASKTFGVNHRIMRPEKVSVIYNAVCLDDARASKPGAEFWKQLGLQPGRPVVGTALRFEPQKGVEWLLRAAALLKHQGCDAQFLIAGDGPLRNMLEDLARTLEIEDVVHFVGWRQDLPLVLQCMDVFCHPTLWEQFPFMVLEAMAGGLPVVATAVDGVPEMVIPDHTGLLVPPGNPQALADALITLLDDPVRAVAMGKAAKSRVEANFTVQTMVAQYEVLLRSLKIGKGDLK